MNKLLTIIILLFSVGLYANSEGSYARSGRELCDFINFEYGFNPMTVFCAATYDSPSFSSPDESTFCHKMILNEKLSITECFDILISSDEFSKRRLDRCEKMASFREILDCLRK